MIDLKELKRLAEGATQGKWYRDSFKDRDFPQIVANKTDVIYQVNENSHTRIRKEKVIDNANYIAAANPSVVLQLIKEHQEMREALESIASKNKPRHDDAKYWQGLSREQCAEVLANDTRIARQTLEGMSK